MRKSFLLLWLIGSVFSGRILAQSQTVTNGSAVTPINFTGAGCAFTWTNDQPSIGLSASGSGNIAGFTAVNTTNSPIVATIMVIPVPVVYAYIPNYFSNTVSVVNTVTNAVVTTVRVGGEPVAVTVSPDGSRAYTANNLSNNVSVINAVTNTVIATIPVGDAPNWVVFNHAGTKVYVSTFTAIKIIDVATNTVTGTLPVTGANSLAIDAADGFLYTVSNTTPGAVQKIDLASNLVVAYVNVGIATWCGTISPDDSKLYVTGSNSNDVTVLNTSDLSTIATIPVGNSPTIAVLSLDGKTIWVTDNSNNTITVIDATTNTVTGSIDVGGISRGSNLSADGKVLFVTVANSLVAISTVTNAILSSVPVGSIPLANGNFLTPPACNGAPSTFTITVDPNSNVSASAVAGYIAACAGTASSAPAIQQFKVNATAATGNVTATASAGFEVSLSLNSGYGNSVSLVPAAGIINNQPVYVRSAATAPAGTISGNITLTGGGVPDQSVAVSGFVSSPAQVDPVSDQVVQNGAPTAAVNFTGTGNTFTWTNDMPGIGLAADGAGNISSFTAINTGNTPITATITVTTKNAGFAYIGQTTGNDLTVINTATHAVLGKITVGQDPYGMWQTPNGGLLYVANNQSNNVSVINTQTQAVIGTIAVPGGPVGLVGSADGSILYAVEEFGSAVAVINTATQTVTTSIPVGNVPEAICLSLDGSTLYVTNEGGNSISVISTATNTVTATIAVGSSPEGICISPDGTKLYEVNDGDNNLYVISTATNMVINTIPVGTQPHNLVISADGSTVYTANQGTNGTISVVNTASGSVTGTIPVGSYPDGLSLTPDGSMLYVTNLNSANVMVINTATNGVTTTIPVDPQPGSLGNFVGNGGCPSQPTTFTIKINPSTPAITVTGTPAPMTTVYGTPSSASSFTISGSNLTAGILAAPPSGFEISTDGVVFTGTVTIDVATAASPTLVYIRLAAATPVSTYTGDLVITSVGAADQNVVVPASTVTPAPLTITADDATRPFGQANPIFTFSYSGFQNNETQAALVAAPQGVTTATPSSPAGDYPIVPAAAEDSNYHFTYLSGTLKITPGSTAVSVPNAFTPNGDGRNDKWEIRNLANYPNCRVTVFNRYGQAIFNSNGYSEPWNGRHNGADVPAGTYVYVIELGNGTKPMTGTVMIIR
jgi:gliding motility-associated-like protein